MSWIEVEPCGFCGMDNTCLTTLIKKANGTVSIISNCIYHHAQMKYNAVNYHLFHGREGPSQPGKHLSPEISGQLLVDIFISKEEENSMDIYHKATLLFREENDILNSDIIVIHKPNLQDKKSERSGSTLQSISKGKKHKR
ncbi:hypothetical protein BDQ17DRAFT_1256265 [Cyathus striatus]|nr:hypothetical protein BDQ17DRAFT_1264668 [Cyathus striatus]KAF8990004.1 hypothetical protein BDQ17DRAFT_1256265 [Cyathus striatus]